MLLLLLICICCAHASVSVNKSSFVQFQLIWKFGFSDQFCEKYVSFMFTCTLHKISAEVNISLHVHMYESKHLLTHARLDGRWSPFLAPSFLVPLCRRTVPALSFLSRLIMPLRNQSPSSPLVVSLISNVLVLPSRVLTEHGTTELLPQLPPLAWLIACWLSNPKIAAMKEAMNCLCMLSPGEMWNTVSKTSWILGNSWVGKIHRAA